MPKSPATRARATQAPGTEPRATESHSPAQRWSAPPTDATRVVGRRALQCVIDVVASSVVPLLFGVLLLLVVPMSRGGSSVGAVGPLLASVLAMAAAVAFHLWYWVARPSRQRGQTWGMHLLGIRVVRSNGLPAGGRALFVRWLMLLVDGLAFGLVGLVAMLTSRQNQRLGDRAAGTVVVRDRQF